MQRVISAFSFLSFFFLALTGTAFADQFEEAKAAYDRGRYAKALELFRPLAKTGDAAAQNNLGVIYANGQGVNQNYAEAAKWFRKAAEQGIADAQSNLGGLYYKGSGVPKDYTEAGKWYTKAAEQGHVTAQGRLGEMHLLGRGVEKNLSEARNWLNRALDWYESAVQSDRSPVTLGNTSYFRLLAGRFDKAEEAAREGLGMDGQQEWIRTNLAHALLLQGRRNEAMSEYGKCKIGHEKALKNDFEILKALFPEKARLIAAAAKEMGL